MKLKLIVVMLLTFFAIKGHAQKEANSSDKTNQKVDQKMPQFPGGDAAFYTYLDENVQLPEGFNKKQFLKKNKNTYVPISVGFTVDVDGSIINVQVIEGADKLLDQKAIKIVENMPKWEPGSQNGSPIKVQYAIPVRFNLM